MITDSDRLEWLLKNGASLEEFEETVSFHVRRVGNRPEWKKRKAIKLLDDLIEKERCQ